MAETFLYLTTSGRVTGKPHTIEIWYVEHENSYYLCAEKRERSDWVKNIMQDTNISFYVAERGQDVPIQQGTGTIIEDEVLIEILREKFNAKYGWNSGLFVRIARI